ncbi:snRNA-activating protein complex subunit 2 [Hoplias malabaricus]|uniref:snRNA-activating protein complex subunit 2 n=1 Tax=Hoplias malabaricus TaxID=27720 RepID=UPI00346337E1
MKPPSRRQNLPSRFLPLKVPEQKRRSLRGWHKYEIQLLLSGLKQQQKVWTELDLLALRKKLPRRTLQEIQNLIKYLKTRVVRQVYQGVHQQKKEEQRTKTPIEKWAALAQKMAGIHEETISSAFSQMLVIAGTEPQSRLYSDPPRSISTLSPVASNLNTVPMLTSHPKSGPTSSPAPGTVLPGGTCKPTIMSPGMDGTPTISVKNRMVTSSPIPPSSISRNKNNSVCLKQGSLAGQSSAKPSIPSTPKSNISQTTSIQNPTVSKPSPLLPTTRSVSTAAVISNSNQQEKQNPSGHSEQQRSMEKECVVDFEKIYLFLNNMNKQKNCLALTAMESAVVLDLLVSLPEELPLLDCKELQHHLLQVYTHLTAAPVKTVPIISSDQRPAAAEDLGASLQNHNVQTAAEKTIQNEGVSNVPSRQEMSTELPVPDSVTSSQSSEINPEEKNSSWVETGLCVLNPFMVPVALLKQKQS